MDRRLDGGWRMEGGGWMYLDPTDLSTFISHHILIPIDMLNLTKMKDVMTVFPAWLCPFKKGAVLLFEEGFLLSGNTSFCKEREEVCQKKSFSRCSTGARNRSFIVLHTFSRLPGKWHQHPGRRSRIANY